MDGLREITEGAGLLFAHGDYKQLATLIIDITNDKALYKNVAERCFNRASQYDINKMLEGYINVYNSLLIE